MFKLTLKGLRANRVRFALTTFGVVLAVSFVISALVLGDGLRRSFTEVSDEIAGGVDLQVRPTSDFGEPEPLPLDAPDIVADIDGVAAAHPGIEAPESAVRVIPPSGEPISIYGPPQLAFNWIDDPELSAFELVDGSAPEPGQFVMDLDSAADHDFSVGDTYDVLTPAGRRSLELSGTLSFGPDNATLGSVLVAVNTAEAGELFGVDGIDTVDVRLEDGVDPAAVHEEVAAQFGDAEVVDIDTVLAETNDEFTEAVDLVSNILLGFGGVALFVSIFIIYNTFAIVVGQRTRELALLRTIGASPTQVRRAVLGEAFVIGVLACIGGILGGIAVAEGIDALMGALGVDLPDYPFVLAPRTIVAGVAIGLGVTLAAAIGPARKASTVPAIAALDATTHTATAAGGRTRTVAGVALTAVGVVAGSIGLGGVGSTATTIAAMAIGAIGVFLGVTALSPLAVRPVTTLVGWPMRAAAGVTGSLAQRNAARNPGRTATTAAALMIGLALVSTAMVVGESISRHIGGTVGEVAAADRFVTDDLEELDFPATLLDDVRAVPAVEQASGFAIVEAQVDGDVTTLTATDLASLDSAVDLDVPADADLSSPHPVLVQADEADQQSLTVGDQVETTFANGQTVAATVAGTFSSTSGMTADYLYDTSALAAADLTPTYEWLAVSLRDEGDAVGAAEVAAVVTADFPEARVETTDEYTKRIEGSIDSLLAVINAMVALAVVIALIGIANTLALSVFERTRELGLVRAVGMSRRQLRRMIRFEAVLVATFGAVLGVAVGVLFGWGVVSALPDTITGTLALPVASILTLVAVAAAAGVIAAWLPARRAGRLDVLDAIAH